MNINVMQTVHSHFI